MPILSAFPNRSGTTVVIDSSVTADGANPVSGAAVYNYVSECISSIPLDQIDEICGETIINGEEVAY